jgi:hypothetical protein
VYREAADDVRCARFGPGHEEAARLFVRLPSRYLRYWILRHRRGRWTGLMLPIAWFMVGAICVIWADMDGWVVWPFVFVLSLVFVGMSVFLVAEKGFFVLDPANEMLKYGTRDVSFASLAVPRVSTTTLLERVPGVEHSSYENVTYHVLESGSFQFFCGDDLSRKMVEDIAARLNSMLLEYYEREEVRAWLKRREWSAQHAKATRERAAADELEVDVADEAKSTVATHER